MLCDVLALVDPHLHERLQPSLRRAMSIESHQGGLYVRDVAVDDRADELVLRLEVVVDVSNRDVGPLGDLGDRRPLDALLVDQRSGARDEPFALACGLYCCGVSHLTHSVHRLCMVS